MNMPGSVYNEMYRRVRDWTGTKEELQELYDYIYATYDDGRDILRRIDTYQTKWIMNLH